MIHENEPLTNRFISVPPDLGQLNCAAYIAGIIRGILNTGGFVRRSRTVVTRFLPSVGSPCECAYC